MASFRSFISILLIFELTAAFSPLLLSTRRFTCIFSLPSWADLESAIGHEEPPCLSIDSVLRPDKPNFSSERPTLFRERHGWCPYSERVWLALELNNVDYDTIRIDNSGGGRPSYYAGQTPQVRWPDGRTQGESMDLVAEVDKRYGPRLQMDSGDVQHAINQFRNIFPNRARPSSRAAFLFQGNGDPLWKSTFEDTLLETDKLLGQNDGPFLCGSDLTAADVAWAPFLERYRYQLPCLHLGLKPCHAETYPRLYKWYQAMDKVPEYVCRVKGDASSWRKVLTMAGFGNGGVPPQIGSNMDDLVKQEADNAASIIDQDVWKQYAATRPHVAETPQAEAGAIIIKNRSAIMKDILKRTEKWGSGLPTTEDEVDAAMRGLAQLLMEGTVEADGAVRAVAVFLDERMCVPRDMGAMSAASIKQLACS